MVDYCPEKIEKAIMKANREVEDEDQVSPTPQLGRQIAVYRVFILLCARLALSLPII